MNDVMSTVVLVAMSEDINTHDCEYFGIEILKHSLENSNISTKIVHIKTDIIENIDLDLLTEKVIQASPKIVGMTLTYRDVAIHSLLAEKIKNKNINIHITSGGSLATHAPIELLNHCEYIDSVIIGEGETTILNLANIVINNGDISGCFGIAWRDDERVVVNAPSEVAIDLNRNIHIEREMIRDNNLRWIRLETCRGCAGKCTFCAESRTYNIGSDKRWRAKSADKVLEEILSLIKTYNIKAFRIIDNAFEGVGKEGMERLKDISEKILNAGIDIFFTALFRADSFTEKDYGLILLLKKAGLVNVFIGAESGFEKTLKLFGKRASVRQTEQAINLFTRAKIAVLVGFIMFHPYSCLEESRANLTYLQKINQAHRFTLFQDRLMLFHGTPLLKKITDDGLLDENFSILNPYGYKNPSSINYN